jgi:hypothetical protein
LEQAIREAVCEWSLAEAATALQAIHGIDLVAAVTIPNNSTSPCSVRTELVIEAVPSDDGTAQPAS